MKQFNDRLANFLGDALSHMNFFYFCLALDLLELHPVIQAHSTITWVTYLSQSVIQLIALPILGAQNKLQQSNHEETMKHVKSLHDKVDAVHKHLKGGE
jgi:hypothetical protein